MTFGSVEVRVARNNSTGLHEVAEKHILGCTSLMSRDDVFEACDSCDSILELEER